MAKTTDVLPYTELVERTIQIARVASENDRSRVRGAVQDVYTRRLPSEEDWIFLLVGSSLSCDAAYTTGVATVTTQDTVLSVAGGAVLTSGMVGRKIKFNTNANVYTITGVTNASTATLSPMLSGDVNVTADAFSLFSPAYALAGDFDRFPKNGGLLLYQGGRPTAIPEVKEQNYYRDYTPAPSSTPRTCRLIQQGTEGVQYVEVQPPPLKAYNLPYEYLKRPVPLRETTAGTVTVAAGGTTATFHGGATLAEANTGWYLRVDAFGTGADSEWYRCLAVNQAASTATLQVAFGVSGATSAGYTLCAAPEYPVKMQPAILFGAITTVTADQNDPLFQFYEGKYRETVNDCKRTFKTRIYQQEVSTIFEEWQYRR